MKKVATAHAKIAPLFCNENLLSPNLGNVYLLFPVRKMSIEKCTKIEAVDFETVIDKGMFSDNH